MDQLLEMLPFLMLGMAAGKKGIEAGRAYVKAYLDDSLVGRGLKRMASGVRAFGGQLRSVGTGMAGIAAAAITPLIGAAKVFSDMGSDMLDLSQRTGLSVESLSELKYAADQSGSSIETVEKGVRKMGQVLLDAEHGSTTAIESLSDLGLTLDDLKGLSPEEQFKKFADAISKVEDPGRRSALAMEIFGKSGSELLPMMLDGAAGIEALQAEARKLGITMSTEDAVAAEKFGDQMSSLSAVMKAKLFSAGAAIVPVLGKIVEQLTAGAVWVGNFIDRNRGLITGLFLGVAAFGALGAGIAVLGTVFSVLGTVIGGITAAVAFLLSPVGLLLVGLTAAAGAGIYFAKQSGLLGRTLDWLKDRFGPIADRAMAAFKVIKDALAAGELGAAAKVAMAGLRLAFASAIAWLQGKWLDFKAFMAGVVVSLAAKIKSIWVGVSAAMVSMIAKAAQKAFGLVGKAAKALGFDDLAKTAETYSFASGKVGQFFKSQGNKQIKGIESTRDRTQATLDEDAAREKAKLDVGVTEAAAELAKAMEAAKTATDEANAKAAADAAEAAKPNEPPASDTAKAAVASAKPAINTAAIVGSQSGADAFLKATQGFGRKITPGEKAIADALKTTNQHLEDIAEGGVALMEDDA